LAVMSTCITTRQHLNSPYSTQTLQHSPNGKVALECWSLHGSPFRSRTHIARSELAGCNDVCLAQAHRFGNGIISMLQLQLQPRANHFTFLITSQT
jgi:hypothetical protein